ncbi:MAG: LD-carboxypeptidase [Clostridia bacterium]|nr:LD-carboxypeptidase [Clostridia bacterium]
MIKPHKLNKGDKVAIVSLSRGLLGMPFCKHELDIAIKRLKDYGLDPVIMPNSLKDMEYLHEHPEERAADLKQAFMDDEIKGIICAIGGDDTYMTIPYLMEDEEFKEAVKKHPKIFTGFSDTTNNHVMLNRLGLETFYGPCVIVDLAELDKEMLPYTKEYFEKFFKNEDTFEITSSPVWYNERESFGENQIGVPRIKHDEEHGYEVLKGFGKATGKLYGGCIESFYDMFTGERYGNENEVYEKYDILPTIDEWKEKILFLETCEEKNSPEKIEKILNLFKEKKILESVQAVIVGKPMDEAYYEEYKEVYKKVFDDIDTPILYNVNYGHCAPRCIVPYGAEAIIDFENKTITINEPIFE